jgi:capsular polysaccharide biosynthesis protein
MWGILLALAATTVLLVLQPATYRSTATVFVRTPGDVSRVLDGGDSYAQARAETYSELASSTSVTSRVVADLGLDLTAEGLSRRIDANHQGGTALMNVAVNSPSAEEAQRTLTVLLNELSVTVRSLESVPGALVPRADLVVVDPPSLPVRILAWGFPIGIVLPGVALIGLVLGAVGAVLRSLAEPVRDRDPEARPAAAAHPQPTPPDVTNGELVGSDATTNTAHVGSSSGRHRAARQPVEYPNEGDA